MKNDSRHNCDEDRFAIISALKTVCECIPAIYHRPAKNDTQVIRLVILVADKFLEEIFMFKKT